MANQAFTDDFVTPDTSGTLEKLFKIHQQQGVLPRPGGRFRRGAALGNQSLTDEEREQIEARIQVLELEHQDLDDIIDRLHVEPGQDVLQLRRLKKRKLVLKDSITRLRESLVPDIPA